MPTYPWIRKTIPLQLVVLSTFLACGSGKTDTKALCDRVKELQVPDIGEDGKNRGEGAWVVRRCLEASQEMNKKDPETVSKMAECLDKVKEWDEAEVKCDIKKIGSWASKKEEGTTQKRTIKSKS